MKDVRAEDVDHWLSAGGTATARKGEAQTAAQAIGAGISVPCSTIEPISKAEKIAQGQLPFLHAIERALDRIEDGGFGYCQSCGDQLSLGRLVNNPTLETCDACEKNR